MKTSVASLIFLFAPLAHAQKNEKNFLHDQISYPLNVVADSLSIASQKEIAEGYFEIVIQFTTTGMNSCEKFSGMSYIGTNSYQALFSMAPGDMCFLSLVSENVRQLIPFNMEADEGILTINNQAYTLTKDADGTLRIDRR